MTDHYFENKLVKLHYYRFGNGPRNMLCFHGYGMHGKQFKLLETALGSTYTFWGFDLFFHKETKLHDQSLSVIKKGISKQEVAALFVDFCHVAGIDRFSVIGYSMGTHYATIITEQLGNRIDEYIVVAPSSLKPGALIAFFSKNKIGNRILEKLALRSTILLATIKTFKLLRIIDNEAYTILYKEIRTPELRFNLYASFTYLRFLETNELSLLHSLIRNNIKSIFIFGKRDKAFPPSIGNAFIKKLPRAKVVILNEGHEMIKKDFVDRLTDLLL